MFREMIARLVAYVSKTGKEAKERIGQTFVKVWHQDGRWFITISCAPTDRIDPTVLRGVQQECGWADLQEDLYAKHGRVFMGTPPAAAAPAPKASRRLNEDELKALHAIRAQHGFSHDDVKVLIANLWGLKSTTALNRAQFQELVDVILPAGRAFVAAHGFFKKGA